MPYRDDHEPDEDEDDIPFKPPTDWKPEGDEDDDEMKVTRSTQVYRFSVDTEQLNLELQRINQRLSTNFAMVLGLVIMFFLTWIAILQNNAKIDAIEQRLSEKK